MGANCRCGWFYAGPSREMDQAARGHVISNGPGHAVTIGELEYRRVMNDVHVVNPKAELIEERREKGWEMYRKVVPVPD